MMPKRGTDYGVGVACPGCGHTALAVCDSRPSLGAIRRRRICPVCHERVTTYEVIHDAGTFDRMLFMSRAIERMPPVYRDIVERLIRAVAKYEAKP